MRSVVERNVVCGTYMYFSFIFVIFHCSNKSFCCYSSLEYQKKIIAFTDYVNIVL